MQTARSVILETSFDKFVFYAQIWNDWTTINVAHYDFTCRL